MKYFENPMKYFINPLKYFGRMFLAGAMIEITADEIWDLESRQPEQKKTPRAATLTRNAEKRMNYDVCLPNRVPMLSPMDA